ncbi:hypothetical protein [Ralstonia phage RP13]|nr:hypothetical protein [Ralstonia phage RP13]
MNTNMFVRLIKKASVMLNASLYENYSGRNMFGETCIGLVTDKNIQSVAATLMYFAAEMKLDEVEMLQILLTVSDMKTDELGKSFIYYFPGVK